MNKKIERYENTDTVKKLIQLGLAFCIIGTAIPILILLLRFINYRLLLEITPGGFIMNPLTSICYALLGFSIWLVRTEETMEKYLLLARILCIIVLSYCLSALIFDFILNYNYQPDRTLIHLISADTDDHGIILNYNSMVFNNALGSILLSLSIIFINHKHSKIYYSSEALNYIIMWGMFLIIYGYIYSLNDLYASLGRVPMAFYSAVTLLLLSSSVLLIRPYKGTMAYLLGENPADVFIMRFLAFFIPLIMGYLKINGEKYNLYNDETGTALFAISSYVIAMLLLGWKSTVQHKLYITKQESIQAIKEDREKMERILNNSQTYIQILDIEKGIILFSNETGHDTFTLGKEIENRKYSDVIKKIIHPDDSDKYFSGIERATKLNDDEYDDSIFRVIDRKNNSLWLLSRATVYKRENKKVTQILFNAIDITEEKQKEEELNEKKVSLKKKNAELKRAKHELDEANKKLEEKAEKHAEDIFKNEELYHNYIKTSFAGIIQYEYGSEGIDISLPPEEQLKLIKEKAFIKEANKKAAAIRGNKNPEEMKNMTLVNYLDLPTEQIDASIEGFIKSGYKFLGEEPMEYVKDKKPIKIYINVFGIIKDNKLIRAWEIQTSAKMK